MACESFHSHGRQHQVDLERRCGDWRGVVAVECIWTISFSLANSSWLTNVVPKVWNEQIAASKRRAGKRKHSLSVLRFTKSE
jgi:hypothetical protein